MIPSLPCLAKQADKAQIIIDWAGSQQKINSKCYKNENRVVRSMSRGAQVQIQCVKVIVKCNSLLIKAEGI